MVSRRNNERAFTLVELLCVLTLLGMMMMVAIPAMFDAGEQRNLEIAARAMATDMRLAQQTAITTGAVRCINIRITVNDYRIGDCVSPNWVRVRMPEGVTIRSTTFPVTGGFPLLRFNRNGAPNIGGTVDLVNTAGEILYVIVTPATGRVRISDVPPEHW
ncbi:MAG TPA: GspH/FimT family pseudopilin [Candidatus Limnocylindrales bacterium]|nr:GspH/FimT family pseudopilin [Candidatus Limnocylindrales bacterium]